MRSSAEIFLSNLPFKTFKIREFPCQFCPHWPQSSMWCSDSLWRTDMSSYAPAQFRLLSQTYLLLLSARDGEYYKFGYRYSCLHLEATGTMIETERAFILLPNSSAVPKRRTNRAFMNYRVPYDMSGICSFPLKKFSADVHPNPGPSRTGIKFPLHKVPFEAISKPSCALRASNGFTQDALAWASNFLNITWKTISLIGSVFFVLSLRSTPFSTKLGMSL